MLNATHTPAAPCAAAPASPTLADLAALVEDYASRARVYIPGTSVILNPTAAAYRFYAAAQLTFTLHVSVPASEGKVKTLLHVYSVESLEAVDAAFTTWLEEFDADAAAHTFAA